MRALLGLLLVAGCLACSGSPEADSLIAELDAKLQEVVAAGNSPSLQVAVIHQDRIIWSRAFGETSTPETVFMNASVQKVFTAAAVLQLVNKGLIELDTDINNYTPIKFQHPDFPDKPITVRMNLAHRSGLGDFPHQFNWDTESTFAPKYRQPCPENLAYMTHEEFLIASLTPEGPNYNPKVWMHEPDTRFRYSVSAFPFLRYLISQVAEQSYEEYMRENIFIPLEMDSSGFHTDEFAGRHALPYTRLDGDNIELPLWNGRGFLMHTTAEDMANFMLAMMNDGRRGDYQFLPPACLQLMRKKTSRHKVLFKGGVDLPRKGDGFGLNIFRAGWLGYGGSVPGYQTLWRYNPSRKVGYVIISNVNAILTGGENYASARSEIYDNQDALLSVLDPAFKIRKRGVEIMIICCLPLFIMAIIFWNRWRKAKQRKVVNPTME